MNEEKPWEFKLNTSPVDYKDKSISEKARELVNRMRILLGDGDYEKGTKIWYDEGLDRLFYQLVDKKNPDIYREIEQGFAISCLKFLKEIKERALVVNESNRKKKKRRGK